MTQRESRPAGNRAAPKSTGDADTHSLTTGLTRRRAAARRMPPLAPCGCIRDPDNDSHPCGGDHSDNMAAAAVAAVALLDGLGTPALLDPRTCRAMWRIGHRRMAQAVHHRTAGAA